MKKYIGTDGIPVDEYELEDVQLLLGSREFFLESRLEKNLETGEKSRRIIPANVKKALQAEKVRICEQDVKTKLEAFKNGFNKKLEKSPDKAATIALELKHWETVFDVSENSTQHIGLITNGHEIIRRAWRQILNGERNYTVNKGRQILLGHNFAEARFEYLKWLRELQRNPKPEMIEGQAFAFTADGKQIENHPLQTIVEYFNEKGAEVQLFTKGNEYALLSISAGIDETELDELARYEADPIELQALFSLKFTEAQNSGKVSSQQSFAKAEANRLRRTWADYADRLPIVGQWLNHLQAIAEPKQQHPAAPIVTVPQQIMERLRGYSEWPKFMQDLRDSTSSESKADTSTAPQESKGGIEVENGVKLTLWQAAFLLAYKREMLYDSRNPDYKVSQNFAKELCHLDSHTSGGLLYDKWRVLRQSSERKRFFSSALDAEKEGNKWHDKRPQSFLKDIEKIVPLLKGDQKTEAENDLSNWNTMYSKAME